MNRRSSWASQLRGSGPARRGPFGHLLPPTGGIGQTRVFQGVVVLALLLAGIVGSSLAIGASTATTATTFETGTEPFTNLECPHPSTQLQRVTSPVREGKYAERISETGSDVWSNGSVRCLLGIYGSNETTGNDYYYHLSYYIPSGGVSSNLLWELHHPSSLYSISQTCSVAPHALVTNGTQLQYRLFTGNCDGTTLPVRTTNSIPGLNPYPRNVWIDFVIHIRFQESSTGLVEVYYRTGSNAWPSSPQLRLSGVPTMPYSNPLNIHNVKLYMLAGLYPGYSGYNRSDSIYLDDVRRETSLGAAEGGAVASPPPAPAPSPTPTPAPSGGSSFTVATNLVDGQRFKIARTSTPWTATTSAAVASVEFWVDGTRRSVDTSAPYAYGSTGQLDLTTLSSGNHTLAVKGIASGGQTASTTITIWRGAAPPPTGGSSTPTSPAPSGPSPTTTTPFTVVSNLFDGQSFKATRASIAWSATTSAAATSVEFWVDGTRRWVDSSSPYQYGSTGALDLTALSSGTHTLALKATAADGRTASTTFRVLVN